MVDQLTNDYASQPAVFLEYNVSFAPLKRYNRWWAAFSGSRAPYPLVMVNSGHQVRSGYGARPYLYNAYKEMVDAELARAPLADFEAYSWRVGNHVKFSGQMTNRSGQILSTARNDATLHALVYEDAHVGVTNRYVRAAVSQAISADLLSGSSMSFDLETPDLTGVNWTNLHMLVLADYRPNGSSGAYDMLQAARAISPTFTLYFPHVDTSIPWQTEIAIINTSPDQTITGTLRGLSNGGRLIETKAIILPVHGRRQINVADEFTDHTDIGYIIFDTDSAAVQGYTKFYQAGLYRAAIPAVKEVNTSDIYISHIDAGAQWWTWVSLVNTTAATKTLTMTFNNGQSRVITLNANEHKTFDIAGLFNNQPQPDIQSAVITNASGIIGLELLGSTVGGNQMDGILLTDKTASTLYYPHMGNNGWWTGIVAYNPSELECTITITPYSAQGTALAPSTRTIAGKEKYIGLVSDLGLPAQTAWFKIYSTSPLSGFELFAIADGNQIAAYAGGGGTGAKTGVFAKIEKNGGWTGIAFLNTEESSASITLTAYNDNGTAVATRVLAVGGHAKEFNLAEAIFPQQDISGATYIAYSSDRNVVGFQLNGTSDGMMLDGLPGLGGTH